MYIQKVEIKNMRSFKHLVWEIEDPERLAGWHVIIGDNGSGKSTFLQSIALALLGPKLWPALDIEPDMWLSQNTLTGEMLVTAIGDKEFDQNISILDRSKFYPFGIRFESIDGNITYGELIEENPDDFDPYHSSPHLRLWEFFVTGWFSVGYRPSRQFGKNTPHFLNPSTLQARINKHISLIKGDFVFEDTLGWLQDIHYRKLDGKPMGLLLEPLKKFINDTNFLPYGVQLKDIDSDGVTFLDARGSLISFSQLSDGYRTILSMTFDLIRQLALTYTPNRVFESGTDSIDLPGVVLIDEIDAHLHPTWQRRIGKWFRRHFPKMQFIVTTHSPLICQSVDDLDTEQDEDTGTVYRLPAPGSDESGEMIVGVELDRLRYGTVLDAYGTGLFGENITRSEKGKHLLEELRDLNQKEQKGRLAPEEEARQDELREIFSTNLSGR